MVLKPTRSDGSIRDPADPKLEPSRIDEKIGKVMIQCDPSGLMG
jgi:hypothetical protein